MSYWSDPPTLAWDVTPSDTVDEPRHFRALYIGVSGDVVIVGVSGEAITYANMPVGRYARVGKRVNATGTTAASIVAEA